MATVGVTERPGLFRGSVGLVSMCILLVTQTVACFVPEGELALFLMCTLLVT